MQPQRIVLANEPRLVREMLKHVIEKSPELRIVGEVADLKRSKVFLKEAQADWVIVSLDPDGEIPNGVESLLAEHPSVCVLAVAKDASCVRVAWREHHEDRLDGLSLVEFLTILHRRSPTDTEVKG